MSFIPRLSLRLWFLAPLLAFGFILWIHSMRVQRVELVSGSLTTSLSTDAESPTGYAGGQRLLIAPGHNNESYQWIAQTQRMVADGEWRLRKVDYDNAPTGRAVLTPSPYRWWLATVGWFNQFKSGRPIGQAIEHGALWADPILHLFFLGGGVGFTWWRFGRLPAMLLSLGVAALFPFAGGFVPGAPDARSLMQLVLFANLLTLSAGVWAAESSLLAARRWFAIAGTLGGGGLWLDVSVMPVLIAVGVGGAGAIWLDHRNARVALPWRTWAVAGATTTLAAYFLEYAPAHLDLKAFRLTEVHPLYALTWLGGGELLARFQSRQRSGEKRKRDRLWWAGAAIAFVSVPAVMWLKHDAGFLKPGVFANRLTLLDETAGAGNFAKWIVQGGLTAELVATALPLGLLGVAGWTLVQRHTVPARRRALAILLVPTLTALLFACAELSAWNTLNLLLLVLLVVASPGETADGRPAGLWLAGVAVALIPGVVALLPTRVNANEPKLTPLERQGLAEREFAHWLARRRGPEGAIVLAPPNLTVSIFYHGGMKGLGSPYRENEEGFRASIRLAGAVHADESHALARQRGVTHIIMPSWDDFLSEYARLGGAEVSQTFVGLLQSWLPPRWLRPLPYYVPSIPGFENEQVFVFEHTDLQDNATALSRLAEYFVDMGQIDLAAQVAQPLTHEYAADLGAQVAKARTEIVRRDRAALTKTLETIAAAVAAGDAESLLWDRRVSLSLVLAAGGRMPLAKSQAERAFYEMTESDLRALPEATLFQFFSLGKTLGLAIDDSELDRLARSLLPPQLREQL
jgi:hypothetical protein